MLETRSHAKSGVAQAAASKITPLVRVVPRPQHRPLTRKETTMPHPIAYLSFNGNCAVEQAQRVFSALADGGTITKAMQPAFWAKSWGMLVDKFGTPWIVNGELIPL
jgi:hypothetical protein